MNVKVLATLVSGAILAPVHGFAGEPAAPPPLTFNAARHGGSAYSLDWNLRLKDDLPLKTGVRIGWSAHAGRLDRVPVKVVADMGNYDDVAATVRRSVEIAAGREDEIGVATITAKRIIAFPRLTQPLDAQLRQSVSTNIRSRPDRLEGEIRASQTVVVDDIAPKTSLQATTSLSSAVRGIHAALKLERQLAPALRISADFSHSPDSNTARFAGRYAWNW